MTNTEDEEQSINDLRKQGYSDSQIQQLIAQQQSDFSKDFEVPKQTVNPDMEASVFESNTSEDLIRYQLELDNILERVEHILRGDTISFDDQGNRYWKKDKKGRFAVLNEYGVRMIMNILSTYITRNTILADYTKDEINEVLYNFGMELNDLIHLKYEEIGFDTDAKKKQSMMLVTQIVDLVRSSYTRALFGKERESLRESRQVYQTMPIYQEGGNPMNPQKKSGFKKLFGGGSP